MSERDIIESTAADPRRSFNAGALRAKLERFSDRTDPGRRLAEALAAVPSQPSSGSREFVNPTRVPSASEAERKPLSAADLVWIDRLPSDPSEVSPDDARTLAEMWARRANSSDARLLQAVFGPIHRRWAVLEAEHEMQAVLNDDSASFRTSGLQELTTDVLWRSSAEDAGPSGP